MSFTKINIKPLSINEAYQGKRFRTKKYDAFISHIMYLLPKSIVFPNKDHIVIGLIFGFSSKSSDIDNCIKTFVDCLVKKFGVDDRNIYELHALKTIVKKGDEFIKFKIE